MGNGFARADVFGSARRWVVIRVLFGSPFCVVFGGFGVPGFTFPLSAAGFAVGGLIPSFFGVVRFAVSCFYLVWSWALSAWLLELGSVAGF